MNTAQNFLSQIEQENEALFVASEMQVEEFFKSSPSIQKMVTHFEGRCANECMNMLEVAKRLIEATKAGSDTKYLKKLAKQVLDEADHFDRVAKVIEHLTGKPLDTAALVERERTGGQAKGANCLTKYAEDDALALATYQFIAEGRAHRVWNKMADIIPDPFISSNYRKIASDEKFHSEIGKESLSILLTDEASRTKVMKIANEMRQELYEISCMNCTEVAAARDLITKAYGNFKH